MPRIPSISPNSAWAEPTMYRQLWMLAAEVLQVISVSASPLGCPARMKSCNEVDVLGRPEAHWVPKIPFLRKRVKDPPNASHSDTANPKSTRPPITVPLLFDA